ncbi:hypothetical protein BaRGS_00005121 [Batillaria attramentaria]|uniref:F-box domain-containing protein n=1 Tax=Batillaria attramentaria TaxID=370345 RepID=A0ABD0LVN4_9CAEN
MAEPQQAESVSQPEKIRRIHRGLVECASYSQSEEGSAALRHPIDRNTPGREPHRGLRPRPRTRGRFQPPRKIAPGADDSPRLSGSSVSGSSSAETQSSSQGASGDQFDSCDDSEMVEQSSDKTIEMLSVLGGFTSAAEVHRQPSPSWADSGQRSPMKNGVGFSQTGYASARYFSKPQRKSSKQWEKDANQKSITHFMKSSPVVGNVVTSDPCSYQTSVGATCTSSCGASQQRPSCLQMHSASVEEKTVYGSPSKMYSPLKQVSDHVYVISDEDSPRSSPEKNSSRSSLSSSRSSTSISNASASSSFVKRLFDGQKAAEEQSKSMKQRGRSDAKTRNSKSAASKNFRKPESGVWNGDIRGQKRKRDFLFGTERSGAALSTSSLRLDDINFNDSDEDIQSGSGPSVSSSTPVLKREVEVGRTFGLLGESKVKVLAVNYFEQLPVDVIENIFCRLPMLDLCLNMNLVCTAWNDIISNEKFVPWKKLYHRLKLDEEDAKQAVEQIIQAKDMSQPSLRLLNLITYMQSFKRVTKENNMCQLLQQHPKYSWAVALLKERTPHCFLDQEPNPWCLVCALVLVAATVEDVSLCLQLLTSAHSHLLSTEVLRCVPIVEAKQSSVVAGIHYRLFYALYLFENTSVSNHSMLQEAMAGQSGQQSIMRIIKYTPDQATGEVVKIFAFAGTGKTTTLVRYAQMRPNLKFLLLVFNKSVCEHAKIKFPRNVTCKTGHGLAFGYTGRKYAAENQLNSGNMRVFDVLSGLEEREKGQKENYFVRAKFVINTLKNYMASADENITTAHTPEFICNDDGRRESIPHDKRMLYAKDAEHYWGRMINLKDRLVKMTHDGYLKLFQLDKRKLWGYDIILVDEAQDMTPALLDIVNRQTQPKIFVGDQHQQIYTFRGAVNAMAGVSANRVFYLTQSFRFGPEVSQVANVMLETLKGERRRTLVGHGVPGKICGEQVGQLAILCRSNFAVFAEAVTLCVYSDQPTKIAIIGGLESFGFPMLEDIYTLMMAPADRVKEKREIQSRFIARFGNIAELDKYAKKTADVELLGKIKIVQTYHHNLPQCVTKIRQKSIRDETQADVLLSTVHKAKGLEFSTVKGGGVCPVLSEQLKKQGISFVCDDTKTAFDPQALTLQKQEVTLSNKVVVRSCVYSPLSLVGNGSEYSHLMGDQAEQRNQEEQQLP